MLRTLCPRCGGPAPASLAQPEVMRCGSCHYYGPTPPEALSQLHAAAAIVLRAPIRDRQLADSVKRAVHSGWSYRRRFGVLFFVCAAPIVLVGLIFQFALIMAHQPVWIALLGIAMFLETVAFGVLGFKLTSARQRETELACAARPPLYPGEPATCHTCGGPVLGGVEAFVRCGFCASDNLVDPRKLAALRFPTSVAIESQMTAVESSLAKMRRANRGATALTLMMPLMLPVFVFAQFVIGFVIIGELQLEPDSSVAYALVPTGVGECVGEIEREDNQTYVFFGKSRVPGLDEKQKLDTVRPIALEALEGKRVRIQRGFIGPIQATFYSPLYGNAVRLLDGKDKLDQSVTGICLAPAESLP